MSPAPPPGAIRRLRQQLVEAKRSARADGVQEIVDGVQSLGRSGYRCCLVDFERFRTACYVRVLGYDRHRIKAEVEYPIGSSLRSVQWLPLSHLADYDETEPDQLRHIYRDVEAYLKRREPQLQRRPARPCGGPAARRKARRGAPTAPMTVWWGVAGVLFTCSLVLFIATQ